VIVLSHVRFFREGVSSALSGHVPLGAPAMCETLDEARFALEAQPSAIVLMDSGLPEGLRALRDLHLNYPAACVVVFALCETEENVVAWAQAGATGYIPMTAALCELVQIVEGILRGEQICSAAIASQLLRRIGSTSESLRNGVGLDPETALTMRERQIMSMIGKGLSNKEIARLLSIEVSTAKSHVHNILGKLGLQRRGQVSWWARKQEVRAG
jgi:DNA-binding NarL/FixJ family response regulator